MQVSRRALVFVLIAALAAAILMSRDQAEPPPTGTHDSASDATAAPANAILAAAPGSHAATSPERTSATPEAPAPATPAPTLRVRLRGLHEKAPWITPLRLALDGRDEAGDEWLDHVAREAPAADGCGTFALPAWVITASRQKGGIEGDDPNYLPIQLRWDGALDLRAELVIDVQVVAVLEGRVVDARREPVPAARITVFGIEDGAPATPRMAETNTGDDGRYRLKAPPGIPLWLLATPMEAMKLSGRRPTSTDGGLHDSGRMRADLLPAGRRAAGIVGTPTTVADLVLPDADQVSGFLRWSTGAPISGAAVAAVARDGNQLVLAGGGGVRLHDNGTISPSATATTGADGAFVLPAVPGVPVEVSVISIPDTVTIGDVPMQNAAPPQRLEFALPLPVQVRVTRAGNARAGATIELEAPWPPRSAGPDGAIALLSTLPSLRLRSSHERLRSEWATIGPESAGAMLVLELTEPVTEVWVDFEGEFPVRNAMLTWRGDNRRKGQQRVQRGDNSGPFRVFLEPGRYHLRAGSAPGERNGTFLLPVERDFDVATEPVTVVLPAQFGGRFVVHATDTNGLYARGTCRVLDAAGTDRTDRFVVRNGDRAGTFGTPGEIMAGGPNEFSVILPPGEYLLEFEFPEHGAPRQRVTIKPREVTDVRIRLP